MQNLSLLTFGLEIFISLIYVVIYKAKKKLFYKQNLLELCNWALVVLVPIGASIPVLSTTYAENPQTILIPFWIGLAIWLLVASKAKLNKNEREERLKILLMIGLSVFTVLIVFHVLIYYFQIMHLL